MKRTTYIVLGLFITGWVLIVANYLLGHFKGVECAYNDVTNLSTVRDSIDMAGVRVINVSADSVGRDVFITGDLAFKDGVDSSKCYYPAQSSKYFSIARKGDTLTIHFHFKSAIAEASNPEAKRMLISGADFSFAGLNSVQSIFIKARGMGVCLDKVEGDSLNIASEEGSIKMRSSKIRALNIAATSWLDAKHCSIDKLYLDLDPIGSWSLDSCTVIEEHLTGSGEHTNQMKKGEAKFVYWKPKKEDASLNLQLKEYSRIEIGKP